jgi:hypothetical protein
MPWLPTFSQVETSLRYQLTEIDASFRSRTHIETDCLTVLVACFILCADGGANRYYDLMQDRRKVDSHVRHDIHPVSFSLHVDLPIFDFSVCVVFFLSTQSILPFIYDT